MQRTYAKNERSKCSGLVRCWRRKIYAMIAVELGEQGRFWSNFEDRFVKTDFGDRAAIVVYSGTCLGRPPS